MENDAITYKPGKDLMNLWTIKQSLREVVGRVFEEI